MSLQSAAAKDPHLIADLNVTLTNQEEAALVAVCGKAGKEQTDAAAAADKPAAANGPASKAAAAKGDNAASMEARAAARLTQVCPMVVSQLMNLGTRQLK